MNILWYLKETPLEQGRETSNTPLPHIDKTTGDTVSTGVVKVSPIQKQVFTTE
jgi:hypothetical protein